MQCPKCGKEAAGDVCAACGAYLTEETPRWYAEGIVHLAGEKQFSMAQELLQEGLQRYPTSSMLWFNAGVLAEMLKKPQDAAAYYQKAYYLKPTSEKYRQTLERVLGRPVPRLAPPPQAPVPSAPVELVPSAPVAIATPAAAEPEPVVPVTLDLISAEPDAPAAEEPVFSMDDWLAAPAQPAEEAEPAEAAEDDAVEIAEPEAEAVPSETIEVTDDMPAASLDITAAEWPEIAEEEEAISLPVEAKAPVIVEVDPLPEDTPLSLDAPPDEPAAARTDEENEVADDPEPEVPAAVVDTVVEPQPALQEEVPQPTEPAAPDGRAGEHDLMPIAVISDIDGEPADDLPDEPAVEAEYPVEPLLDLPEIPAALPAAGVRVVWPGWRLVRLLSGPLAVLAGLAMVVFLFAGKGALFVTVLLVCTALVILYFVSSALSDHDRHGRR